MKTTANTVQDEDEALARFYDDISFHQGGEKLDAMKLTQAEVESAEEDESGPESKTP